jgi:hypothetical protein
VFDLFDFTPVDDDPFKKGSGTPSPLVTEFQKSQPPMDEAAFAAASSIPTDSTVQPDTMVGRLGKNILKTIADFSGEGLAHYAGNPAHPIENRMISAGLEEGSRTLNAVPNALQEFMGPMYGEGHVPVFNEGGSGADYAGAGITLASLMGGPGGEEAMGAGWNPGASKYLDSLIKSKPGLKPEAASVVKELIANGPAWGQRFFESAPESQPGKGFAALATTKHLVEEAAKPKPQIPTPQTPISPAAQASLAKVGAAGEAEAAKLIPSSTAPAPVAAPSATGAAPPMPAGFSSSYGTPAYNAPTQAPGISVAPAPKPPKKPSVKTVSSAPVTPEQALGFGGGATANDLAPVFTKKWPKLQVPSMAPYNPNVKGSAAYSMETAPGTSGQTLPFNPSGLPMDQASVTKRMQEQNVSPLNNNLIWWRGVAPHGPYSWDSANVGYKDPITKDYEPGLFFHPDVNAKGKPGAPNAQLYGANLNPHVLKTTNPLVMEWKAATKGSTMYSKSVMSKIIKDAWAKGHDALLLKNINDIGGTHDQLIVRYPHQVRHPSAAFDPKYANSPNLLAARGTGVPPMVVQDKDLEEGGENEQSE